MKKIISVVLLLVIFVFVGFLWWTDSSSPADFNNKNSVVFVVEKGKGIREISTGLKEKGLIKSPVAFFILIKQTGLDKGIQAGKYCLSASMTMQEITQKLTHGGVCDVTAKIIEGQRAAEIAEILKKSVPTYDSSWITTLVANEGYLFPDTYRIPIDANIEGIIAQMRDNFDSKYAEINTNNSKLLKSQIVILASLIEREAITNEERPIIAGILMNRLNAGIALQVDATIQYAKGKNPLTNKWWEPVMLEEYKSVISQYNTYLHAGLPPGPISNPGLESLRAAANPTDTDYLYYIHDKTGQIRYAKTAREHSANVEKYL
jgi:UPF0755 protein